jgi:hypothetical protein
MKTIPQLSQELDIPQTTLRDARSRNAFPSQQVGRDWQIDETSPQFAAWLEARPKQPRVIGAAKKTNKKKEQNHEQSGQGNHIP